VPRRHRLDPNLIGGKAFGGHLIAPIVGMAARSNKQRRDAFVTESHDKSARLDGIDYLDHLARESARFASVLADTPSDAQVPTCPGWNADDLLWHLGEVQWFWGTIVRDGADVGAAEQMKPPRPANRPGLAEFYRTASRELMAALANTNPDTPAWTWAADKTVGFIRRRQAHEALIHRLDAELTAERRTGLDPRLSADGVDEVLRIMYGGDVPAWGTFTTDGSKTIRVRCTDTGDSWLLRLGHFSGTDPDDQRSYDQPGIDVATQDPGVEVAAAIAGSAADLDCWLWGRPALDEIERTGDAAVLDEFAVLTADGIS
jgi:uncharacterized protein (TIGR03083 family)